MKKAIIVGATSGIGRELAVILSWNGYMVGLAGRRLHLLEELKNTLHGAVFPKQMDISDLPGAMMALEDPIEEMGGLSLMVISVGIGFINPDLNWAEEKQTIDVNVAGFAAMANVAYRHFERVGGGHLVGISSYCCDTWESQGASLQCLKSFVSNYLEGLRSRALTAGLPIVVTDMQPGFVDAPMARGEGLFWVASPQKAAGQIYSVIERKAKHAYITKRWRLIGWVLKVLPGFLHARL